MEIDPAQGIVRLDARTRSGLLVRGPARPRLVPRRQAESKSAGESSVSVDSRLEGAVGNPAVGGSSDVALHLLVSERAKMSLFDVTGRQVAEQIIAEPPQGRGVVRFGASSRLRPGLYFIRLEQGRRGETGRVVVLD